MAKQEDSILPVSEWEKWFLEIWDQEDSEKFNKWSTGDDSYWYYFLAYGIDGNTAMYEATGNTEYLDRALLYINNVVKDAKVSSSFPDSQYKDNYMGWICRTSGEEEGQEVPLYESYMWRYVTETLRVIRQTPGLYDDSKYKDQYDSLLAFTEVNIFEKWYSRGTENIYRSRTHMASHWAYIATDLGIIGTYEPNMPLYTEVRDKINQDLRGQIIPNPVDASAYFWNSVWGSYDRPGQDVSHGNNVISYMVESHDKDPEVYWNDDDITGLINLLMKVLWNQSYDTTNFADYFDGTYEQDPDNKVGGTGCFQYDGFIKLGRYEEKVQGIYENYYQCEECGGPRNHAQYKTQFFGNGGRNAKILLEK